MFYRSYFKDSIGQLTGAGNGPGDSKRVTPIKVENDVVWMHESGICYYRILTYSNKEGKEIQDITIGSLDAKQSAGFDCYVFPEIETAEPEHFLRKKAEPVKPVKIIEDSEALVEMEKAVEEKPKKKGKK